jgi:hypothetical protein
MKRHLVLLAVFLTSLLASGTWALDPYYHTNAEIDSEIHAWQQLLPEYVQLDSIGHSQQDFLPIWAV